MQLFLIDYVTFLNDHITFSYILIWLSMFTPLTYEKNTILTYYATIHIYILYSNPPLEMFTLECIF